MDKFEMFLRDEITHAEIEKERTPDGFMRMAFVGQIAAFKAVLAVYVKHASDVSTRPETGEGHTGPCREGCKCMGPARAQDDCDFYKGLLCNCKKAHSQDALHKKDYITGKQTQNADAWIKCPCGTMFHLKDSPTWVCPDCRDNAQQEVTKEKRE